MAHNAAENEGVKALLEQLREQIAQINDLLLNADSKELGEYERDRIIDQKRIMKRILAYFETEEQLNALEKEIDKNL